MENKQEASIELFLGSLQTTADVITGLSVECNNMARAKGFYDKFDTISDILEEVDKDNVDEDLSEAENKKKSLLSDYKRSVFGQKVALMHSELSEALEGDRKSLMDDKLPQYKMKHVEIADAIIRALDYCGENKVPIGEIILAKMNYNNGRPYMHGKSY